MSQVTPSVPARRRWFSAVLSSGMVPPWLLVVIAIISVQVGAAFAKGLFEVAGPTGVVFLRTSLTGLLFVALWRPNVRALSRRQLIEVVLYGINIAVMMLAFYAAIERIPMGITVAISFVGPLALAVFGSRRRIDLMWALLAAIGILLLSPITNTHLDPVGILLAFVSGATWAVYVLLGKRICTAMDGNSVLAIAMTIAALVVLPFGVGGAAKVLAAPSLIMISLVVALLSSAVPFALEFEALRHLPPRVFGLMLSLEPVVATVVGFAMLQEALGWRELTGILMVTVAAAATARSA